MHPHGFLVCFFKRVAMTYDNQTNIPLPFAVFLATDDYIHHPNTISTTSLIKPIKQLILAKRVPTEDAIIDIASLVSARMGTAIHTALDKAWDNPTQALQALGYSERFIERIKINPDPKTLSKSDIPIYKEQRAFKDYMGYTISGQYDFVIEDTVMDLKSTSVYSYLNQSNTQKYKLQGSIYRWLNPDIIKKDYMVIQFVFTDWSKVNSLRNAEYPKSKHPIQKIPLLSLQETEQYIKDKLKQINQYKDSDESEIPPCSDEDLWRKPTVYKYFKNPNSTRATKNFDSMAEALQRYHADGAVGTIQTVKGYISACKYCPAFPVCKQKDDYINSGELIL